MRKNMLPKNEYLKQFSKLPIKDLQNPHFLALLSEFWKDNYLMLECNKTEILYIFWIQPDGKKLKTHLGIYLEVKGEVLTPHLIFNKIPRINQPNTIVYIFTPSSLKRWKKDLNAVQIEHNLLKLNSIQHLQCAGNILQYMNSVYRRMKDGYRGSYSSDVVKIDNQSKYFYDETRSKRNESIDGKYEVPNFRGKNDDKNLYFSPKDEIRISNDPINFKKWFPKFIASVLSPKVDLNRFEDEIHWLEKQDLEKLNVEIYSSFLKVFREIILEELEFYDDITVYEIFQSTIYLSEFLTGHIPQDKRLYDWAVNNMMVTGLINPYLEQPCLTRKGLIIKEILYLGGMTIMIRLRNLSVPKNEDNNKLKDFSGFKKG